METEAASLRAQLADASFFRRDPAAAAAAGERLPRLEADIEAAVERWGELEERR
jgi:hypothetical protein